MSYSHLTAHELGRDQEEFLEKNFKYVFLGKQQSANSSQINTLNMSNASLFCSAPFLGFKVTDEFRKQNQIFYLLFSSISICGKKEVFKKKKNTGLFRIASITLFFID